MASCLIIVIIHQAPDVKRKKTLSFYDWKHESFQMRVSLKWNVSNNHLAAEGSE